MTWHILLNPRGSAFASTNGTCTRNFSNVFELLLMLRRHSWSICTYPVNHTPNEQLWGSFTDSQIAAFPDTDSSDVHNYLSIHYPEYFI